VAADNLARPAREADAGRCKRATRAAGGLTDRRYCLLHRYSLRRVAFHRMAPVFPGFRPADTDATQHPNGMVCSMAESCLGKRQIPSKMNLYSSLWAAPKCRAFYNLLNYIDKSYFELQHS
jgi:hypothetical protein